tara:strand:- start:103 stop:492 length:390 start_codon:yes stop_codon:yes gene_type:complete
MLQGKNPMTGADVHEWGCSIAWIPLLLVENSSQSAKTTAATESFRNEMVKSNNVMTAVLAHSDNAKRAMATASSIFQNIGDHQRALELGNPDMEDKTIRQLANNKVKVKPTKTKKKTNKKVKKNVNNNK